jgi:hypothetical protein
VIKPGGKINAHHKLDAKAEYALYVRGCKAGLYRGTPMEPASFETFLNKFPKVCPYCTGWMRDGDQYWFLGISTPKPEDQATWMKQLEDRE